jgi:hypothetical protein
MGRVVADRVRACAINATTIGGVGYSARLFHSFRTLAGDQKLFPHLSKTSTAKFEIEQVQYGGHDHPPSFE